MTIRLMLSVLVFLLPVATMGQGKNTGDQTAIEDVIKELFAAYRAGDSSRVAAVFTRDAMIRSLYTKAEGENVITEAKPIDVLLDYIGGGLAEEHDERIWDIQVNADDQLATVWARYVFYLGGKLTHCGTETFLLRKQNNKWQIFFLADTRQTSGCKVPAEVKK